jgi:hypothetical protein
MKIRSITAFIPVSWPVDEGTIASCSRFLTDARLRLTDAGFEVQMVSMATPPFLDVVGDPDATVLLDFAQTVDAMAAKHHIDAVSIGPVVATTPLSLLMPIHALPKLIAKTERIYSGVMFADEKSGINFSAAYVFAEMIQRVAQSTAEGMGNLRLGAMANVPPHIPYFPAAYHQGGPSSFSIATEAADLALDIINTTQSLAEVRQRLVKTIEGIVTDILSVADNLVDDHQIRFNGLDFSLAPSAAKGLSIGAAIEKLGVDAFGGSGSLFASAFLANCIQRVTMPRIGFSGLMLPVLEDEVLAQRAAEGRFSVNDLLLYAAVGGAGPDAVPIPGNTNPDEMAAIFLDLAALAISLGKPLMARLVPIPDRAVGEKVSLDANRFASSRVLPVKNLGAEALFKRTTFLQFKHI